MTLLQCCLLVTLVSDGAPSGGLLIAFGSTAEIGEIGEIDHSARRDVVKKLKIHYSSDPAYSPVKPLRTTTPLKGLTGYSRNARDEVA